MAVNKWHLAYMHRVVLRVSTSLRHAAIVVAS
jgi:hypothetical protein